MTEERYKEKDIKFMICAKTIEDQFVTCVSPRKIGSVIVKNDRVVAQGVNGPPNHVAHVEDRCVKISDKTYVMGRGWFYSETQKEWIHFKIADEFNNIKVTNRNMKTDFVQKSVHYWPDAYDNSCSYENLYDKLLSESKNFPDVDFQKIVEFSDANDSKGNVVKVLQEAQCPRRAVGCASGEMLDICGCVHSEANCVSTAARNGISLDGTAIYCHCPVPCVTCCGLIINSGIKKVFYLGGEKDYGYQSRLMFEEAKIELIEIPSSVIDNYISKK